MMLGLLLARAGIAVVVLEKHADFLRDFRGDTIHPSTLEVMYELGIVDDFLRRPHQEVRQLKGQIGNQTIAVADFTHLPTHCKFLGLMPQWDFLDFIVEQARRYPSFNLKMQAEVTGLLDQRRLMELFDDGSTIVLDSIHHWIPEVRELCHGLQEELGGTGRATAFITPPHEFGLELHADAYEIFVLQIAGSKEWSLYPRLDPIPREGLNLDRADFADVAPDVVVLREGDLLYVPWGTPHSVKPIGTLSAHVSIAVNFPTWADILSQAVEYLLADEGLNGAAHLRPGTEPALAAELKARLDDLAGQISAIDAQEIAAQFVEYATYPERRQANTTLTCH